MLSASSARGAGCRSAASSARRGAAAGCGLSRQQRRRGAISYRRGIIEPPLKSRPRKTPHGKRATKKEVGAAAGRVYLFFRVNLSGRVLDYSPGLLSSPSGGVNPSRAILSAHACMMYLCKLCPLSAAAARTFAPSSFAGRSVMLSCRRLYAMFAFFCAALVGIVSPPF